MGRRFLTFLDPVMSFLSAQIYPTISTLQSSYSSYTHTIIPSPERIICDEQDFICEFTLKESIKVVGDQKY